jgi:hypothetical protein
MSKSSIELDREVVDFQCGAVRCVVDPLEVRCQWRPVLLVRCQWSTLRRNHPFSNHLLSKSDPSFRKLGCGLIKRQSSNICAFRFSVYSTKERALLMSWERLAQTSGRSGVYSCFLRPLGFSRHVATVSSSYSRCESFALNGQLTIQVVRYCEET